MIEFSWGSVYAIYAVHFMSRNPGRFVTVSEIAGRGEVPEAFLANLLPILRRAGIVEARRGRGYKLARPAAKISVYEILAAVDGERAFPGECVMRSLSCGRGDMCDLGKASRSIREYVTKVLNSVTVDRLPIPARRRARTADKSAAGDTP